MLIRLFQLRFVNGSFMTIDDTFGPDSISYIINDAEISILFLSEDKLETVLSILKRAPVLTRIVVVPRVSQSDFGLVDGGQDGGSCASDEKFYSLCEKWAADRNISMEMWHRVLEIGKSCQVSPIPPNGSDLATICYTSGTTGAPKGAMLTHQNYVSAIPCLLSLNVTLESGESHISFLPLAHCFERLVQVAVIFLGGAIGFYHGNLLRLSEDMQILQPSIFIGVPRLFNKIFSRLAEQTIRAKGIRGAIFRQAFRSKEAQLRANPFSIHHRFWDSILFRRIAAAFGGKIRFFICGSAPINPAILRFFRVVLSAHVFEGYGATESSACGSITPIGDPLIGSVGFTTPGGKLALRSVSEMEYTIQDKPFPRGEILIKGPYLFHGYYKNQKLTEEVMTEDGWFVTGDIGTIDAENRLFIIDRKKHLFKLAQGEWVAPERLEDLYSSSPMVGQIFVDGNPDRSYLVAVVYPGEELSQKKSDTRLLSTLLEELNTLAKNHKLQGFEFIKKIHIEWEPFTMENGLLTPTMKIKRHAAKKKYKTVIDRLYAEDDLQDGGLSSRPSSL